MLIQRARNVQQSSPSSVQSCCVSCLPLQLSLLYPLVLSASPLNETQNAMVLLEHLRWDSRHRQAGRLGRE